MSDELERRGDGDRLTKECEAAVDHFLREQGINASVEERAKLVTTFHEVVVQSRREVDGVGV